MFTLFHSWRVAVRPVKGHLTPKMNITFFNINWILNIFLFNNFFWKKHYIPRKLKNCFGGTFDHFLRERRSLTPKINITSFITKSVLNILFLNSFFHKKTGIFRAKSHFWGQVRLEGKGASGDENEYNLFYGKWGWISFHLTIFLKKATLFEKMVKKILEAMISFWEMGSFYAKN